MPHLTAACHVPAPSSCAGPGCAIRAPSGRFHRTSPVSPHRPGPQSAQGAQNTASPPRWRPTRRKPRATLRRPNWRSWGGAHSRKVARATRHGSHHPRCSARRTRGPAPVSCHHLDVLSGFFDVPGMSGEVAWSPAAPAARRAARAATPPGSLGNRRQSIGIRMTIPPITSPTSRSVRDESLWLLWQATQASTTA